MSAIRRHPLITFFALSYAIGWGFIPFWTFAAFSPLVAAFVVISLTQGLSGLKELGLRMIRWRVRWYWYVVAIALPLAAVMLTAGLNVALGASAPSMVQFSSISTILLVFAVRLVNPGDGPLGEEPGWRGFALPGLQSTLSPLASTMILAVLVTGWHVPILFLEEGGLQPSFFVGYLLASAGVTFWYTWMFNRTGGSVLITLISHSAQGTITISGFWAAGADLAQANLLFGVVASAFAIGLVVFDWKAWRGPAAPETTTPSQAMAPRAAAPAAPS